jgi:hypothetical protein
VPQGSRASGSKSYARGVIGRIVLLYVFMGVIAGVSGQLAAVWPVVGLAATTASDRRASAG